MDKDSIRRRVKARKTLLNEIERLEAATNVFHQLEQLAAFAVSQHVLVYHSLPDELSTREFIDRWNEDKHFYLPRVNGVNLDILPYDATKLMHGAFHIEEPTGDNFADPQEMDMIIVPAVAYDRYGNRVGRGKGFYDRLLSSTKALRIGVAYDFQIVDEINDLEDTDIPVDMVITESTVYICRHKR